MDQVVCIRDDFWHVTNHPIVGMVYTVREIRYIKAIHARPEMPFYLFEEIHNSLVPCCGKMVEPVFDAEYFRPVKKTSINALLVLQRTKEDV